MANQSGFEGVVLVRNLAETEMVARRLAPHLRRGDTIALQGELGAGKSTLARAILRACGVHGEVPSPTFTLIQEYEAPQLNLVHCDLYRICHSSEVDELGLEDALHEGAALVEWAERARSRIPADALWIEIAIAGETARELKFSGPQRWAWTVPAKTELP